MKKWGNKVEKIVKVDQANFVVKLKFNDGATGTVSLRHIFENPKGLAAEILKGGMFDHCFVESGALAWPNGFELCPDALRKWLTEQHENCRRAA